MKYFNKFKLDKKIAFVLGGSGTIGHEVCKALSDVGAKVINIDKKKNINHRDYPNINFTQFDLKNIKRFDFFIKKVIAMYGIPNIFINCSYPFDKNWSKSSFNRVSLKSVINNTNLHLISYIWCARVIAEEMKLKKINGSIIQFSSTYGIVGQNSRLYMGTNLKENAIYSAIKGGIINQTKQMAAYYGKFNIRVNSISPGGIEGKIAGKKNKQNKKFINRYSKMTPLKRMGRPQDIAPATIFLASEASSYITGSNIVIDGGWTII